MQSKSMDERKMDVLETIDLGTESRCSVADAMYTMLSPELCLCINEYRRYEYEYKLLCDKYPYTDDFIKILPINTGGDAMDYSEDILELLSHLNFERFNSMWSRRNFRAHEWGNEERIRFIGGVPPPLNLATYNKNSYRYLDIDDDTSETLARILVKILQEFDTWYWFSKCYTGDERDTALLASIIKIYEYTARHGTENSMVIDYIDANGWNEYKNIQMTPPNQW